MFRPPGPLRLPLLLGVRTRSAATLACCNNSLARSAYYSTCTYRRLSICHHHLHRSQPLRNRNIHRHLSPSYSLAPARSLGSFRTFPHRGFPPAFPSPTGNPLVTSARPLPGISRSVEIQDSSDTTKLGLDCALLIMQPTSATPAATAHIPPRRRSSRPLSVDFFQQQIARQQRSNYHSTSLKNMVANSVNRTALHPGGVQYDSLHLPAASTVHAVAQPFFQNLSADKEPPLRPTPGHTELEEELHETAHIDYERVSIVRTSLPTIHFLALKLT